MGRAAEILQDVLGSAEGWLGVHDPMFAKERTQPGSEELGMGERCEFTGQVQLTAFESRLQAGDELATKPAPQLWCFSVLQDSGRTNLSNCGILAEVLSSAK